jgi:hypothetical protein
MSEEFWRSLTAVNDLPKMPVRIAKISRVNTPGSVMGLVGDRRACCLCLREDFIDVGTIGHNLAQAKGAALRRWFFDLRVLSEFGPRVEGKHHSAAQTEQHDCACGINIVASELRRSNASCLEAQPIAVECQGTLKVAHRKRNNVKAMIHGF